MTGEPTRSSDLPPPGETFCGWCDEPLGDRKWRIGRRRDEAIAVCENCFERDAQERDRDRDPYTVDRQLCDDDGIVRNGPLYSGDEARCPGSTRLHGEHVRCTSPAHGSVRQAA